MNAMILPLGFQLIMNETPMELFSHGGIIMWPILALSLLTMTVVIERLLFTFRENKRRDPAQVEQIFSKIESGDFNGAIKLGTNSKDYVARIIAYALKNRGSSMDEAFLQASNEELTRFSKGLNIIDTCITAAPLLGLLGTVTGMMRTFGSMTGELGAASQITGGVAEALIATACGLTIAILGLLPFSYLNGNLENARHDIEDASNALDLIMKKGSARMNAMDDEEETSAKGVNNPMPA